MHTHTHANICLTALCPGLPRWASTRKVKPIWILLKQETMSGSGISWAICKSAPCSRQIIMPAPYHSVFYMPDGLPAAKPSCRCSRTGWRHTCSAAVTKLFDFQLHSPFLPSHYLPPQNSGPCNSFYCLGHFKNVYDDDDDETNSIKALKAGEYWLVFECILLTHLWQESRANC